MQYCRNAVSTVELAYQLPYAEGIQPMKDRETEAQVKAANTLSAHWDTQRAERDSLNRAILAMPDNWTVRPELRTADEAEDE